MTNITKEHQEAINWLMLQRIKNGDGESTTVMKHLAGDSSNSIKFSGEDLAYYLAKYLDEKTK